MSLPAPCARGTTAVGGPPVGSVPRCLMLSRRRPRPPSRSVCTVAHISGPGQLLRRGCRSGAERALSTPCGQASSFRGLCVPLGGVLSCIGRETSSVRSVEYVMRSGRAASARQAGSGSGPWRYLGRSVPRRPRFHRPALPAVGLSQGRLLGYLIGPSHGGSPSGTGRDRGEPFLRELAPTVIDASRAGGCGLGRWRSRCQLARRQVVGSRFGGCDGDHGGAVGSG
jgi:hypothetical protein